MPSDSMTGGGDSPEFLPNPHETIEPTSDWDALIDAVRYMGWLHPRDQVRELVEAMDSVKIVLAVQGKRTTDTELNRVEMHMATTIDWSIRKGLLDSSVTAIALLEGIKQEIRDGGIFIGEERSGKVPLDL